MASLAAHALVLLQVGFLGAFGLTHDLGPGAALAAAPRGALTPVACGSDEDVGACLLAASEGDEVFLMQTQLDLGKAQETAATALFMKPGHDVGAAASPDAKEAQDEATVADDPELDLGYMEYREHQKMLQDNNTGHSGHLHNMANNARWFGWRHLSRSHRNGTLAHPHTAQDHGTNFFRSASRQEWIILVVVCAVLCAFDGLVLRRAPKGFRWHLAIIGIWIAVAGFYLWGVWVRLGRQKGIQWISGYVLEWMLSMDNLFIFHLVFQTYKTPQSQIHKAVFVGIIGAVVMRMVFFLVVSTLLHAVGWFRWPFGAMLVWSGIEAVRGEDDDDTDVKDTRLVRCLKWMFGSAIKDGYDTEGDAIFIWSTKERRVQLSMLFIVIVIVEFSDIIFALDSVSAKVAQIPNQYIAFSSSVMAMYGLRAMFFIVQDLVEMFDLLKYGLGVILCFIGVELMFARWIHMASGLECILIVAVFVVCIIASHIKSRFFPQPEEDEEAAGEEANDAEKEDEKEENPNPLDGLAERPEGEQLEPGRDEGKAWAVQEGRKAPTLLEEKEAPSNARSRSEPDIKRTEDHNQK